MPESRRPLVAANWKMNMLRREAAEFLDAFVPRAVALDRVDVTICPPLTALEVVVERCAGTGVTVAAQNMYFEESGAFTGEVSAAMLTDAGADGVILGHSERRALFGETDADLARKVPVALDAGLVPILCVGETESQRDADETEDVLRSQLETDLSSVEDARLGEIVVAYEPVWAIGTGRTATPGQAQEAVGFIRSLLAERDPAAAEAVCILYGGSMKPGNAAELMAQPDIDGGLVGGASLAADDFAAICEAAA